MAFGMRVVTLGILFSLLTSCGWHLRGVTPLPAAYRVMYLDSQVSDAFNQQLRLQLTFNDVLLTEQREDSPAHLRIEDLEVERRTLAVTSAGQVAEYELNARLNASVFHESNEAPRLIEVKARRSFTNDLNNVVGTAGEERKQRTQLEKELVRKLMQRLQNLATSSDSNS